MGRLIVLIVLLIYFWLTRIRKFGFIKYTLRSTSVVVMILHRTDNGNINKKEENAFDAIV